MTVTLAVIFGGDTPEHEISLVGAKAVLAHAEALGWAVLPVGVTRSSHWLIGPGALQTLWHAADPRMLPRGTPTDLAPVGSDIPWAQLSSSILLILLGVVSPGSGLVVEGSGFQAAVQDAD
ncbi:MAG: hypothetical protein ACRDTE_08600, partial [Pseudonocardiaceae bacterium]